MSDRAEIISMAVRLGAAAAISFFTVRYLVKYLDPNYKLNEESKKRVTELFREIGLDKEVELNEHEVRIATQFVGGQDVGANWSDIGGCDELIDELKDRVILPLTIASESTSSLLCPPKGILLYGPPGCGKTLIAKAVARAAGCRFINMQVSNLTDKWYGESQKLTAALFSVAQKFQTAMMKAQFMTLWDGFATTNDQVIVMGATNRPTDVDPAILRRMAARFFISLPSQTQRRQILKVILREETLAEDADLEAIAEAANGLSGSDLKEVCRLAVLSRAKKTLADCGSLRNRQILQQSDLINALSQYIKASRMLVEHGLD
ncbi:hypothetical protein WR25_14908 [Diploscapter pachys]|uniref:AAA+ ATPase domain-containing protein n=1 Tax=Diploscapter pachys TaxID=2018661 RepID=A0A2A2J4H9_9BILA|nr:hypothetical protein WR25_14908 [Diploscapter pachys]